MWPRFWIIFWVPSPTNAQCGLHVQLLMDGKGLLQQSSETWPSSDAQVC